MIYEAGNEIGEWDFFITEGIYSSQLHFWLTFKVRPFLILITAPMHYSGALCVFICDLITDGMHRGSYIHKRDLWCVLILEFTDQRAAKLQRKRLMIMFREVDKKSNFRLRNILGKVICGRVSAVKGLTQIHLYERVGTLRRAHSEAHPLSNLILQFSPHIAQIFQILTAWLNGYL